MEVEEFEHFFELMRPRLMRAAMRSLDADAANEAAIAALHTIWTKNIPAPRDETALLQLQALAYRIVEGNVRNAVRAQTRHSRLMSALADHTVTSRNTESDTADWLETQASEQAVDELLASLPDTEREVVQLVIDGFKVSEIAAMLGRRPGAISTRLNRARKHLRQALERRADDTHT